MRISFCTTCKGRLEHLKKTLLQNIADNLPRLQQDPDVEFVVLDYDCPDGTIDWLLNSEDIREWVESGVVKVASLQTETSVGFHHAHAKNMVHRLATGDVVCNVDADNYLGKNFASHIASIFKKDEDVIVHPHYEINNKVPHEERGFFGRIALTRKNFIALGGYDEALYPAGCGWGGEDTHLLRRAKISGLKDTTITEMQYLKVIAHGNEKRVELTVKPEKIASEVKRLDQGYDRFTGICERLNVVFHSAQAASKGNIGIGKVMYGVNREDRHILPLKFYWSDKAHRSISGLNNVFKEFAGNKLSSLGSRLGFSVKSIV